MNIPETVLEAVDLILAGQFEKSERLLKKVFRKDPDNFDAIHASALLDIGKSQPARSLKKLKQLLQRASPAQSNQLVHSMGLAYQGLGDLEAAVDCFQKVYNARPDSSEAGKNLAKCLEKLQRYEEAIKVCKLLLGTFEDKTEIEFLALQCRYKSGDVDQALDELLSLALRKTLTLSQHEETCYILEHHYRYRDVRALATAGLVLYPSSVPLALQVVRCDVEEGKLDDAIALLESLAEQKQTHEMLADIYYEMGTVHDKQGNFREAFDAFARSNEQQRHRYKTQRVRKSASVAAHKRLLEKENYLEPLALKPRRDAGADLCFLVGFPRSGTTLLERVLDSHSEINALPEVNFLYKVTEHLGGWEKYPQKLCDLQEAQLQELEDIYRGELASMQLDPAALTIDKLPLNMVHAPLIQLVFPKAKFILALRHPADCTLSCFMQNFRRNPEMAYFLSLSDAADRYADVFKLWNTYCQHLPLNQHQLRYEDLVSDFDTQLASLMDFLGLEIEESQSNYHETTAKKGAVRTPSFRQVSKPIYKSSSYRWKNYEFAMAEYLPVLQPFIEQFGYAE